MCCRNIINNSSPCKNNIFSLSTALYEHVLLKSVDWFISVGCSDGLVSVSNSNQRGVEVSEGPTMWWIYKKLFIGLLWEFDWSNFFASDWSFFFIRSCLLRRWREYWRRRRRPLSIRRLRESNSVHLTFREMITFKCIKVIALHNTMKQNQVAFILKKEHKHVHV